MNIFFIQICGEYSKLSDSQASDMQNNFLDNYMLNSFEHSASFNILQKQVNESVIYFSHSSLNGYTSCKNDLTKRIQLRKEENLKAPLIFKQKHGMKMDNINHYLFR